MAAIDDLVELLAQLSTTRPPGRLMFGIVDAVPGGTTVKVKIGPATIGTSCAKAADYTPAVGHTVAVWVDGAIRYVFGNVG